jgi:iron complex transport system substrate-binding protein
MAEKLVLRRALHNRQAMRLEGCHTNLSEPIPEARRIVSVGPSNTEILHVLGLGRRIVGVDRWSDYPPRVVRLPRVGSDLRVDVEAVVALRPDVVVTSLHVPGMEHNLSAFQQAGLQYIGVGGVGLSGVWADLRFIGEWLGRAARAEALVHEMQTRMAGVPRSARGLRVHWEWSAHPVVAGRRSWITELLEMVGAENAYADLDVESVRVSLDEAARRQPDVVVACWCGVRRLPAVERVLRRPGWQSVKAFAGGRVAVVSEAYFGRPGPRLVDGLQQLAALLSEPIESV